MTYTLDLTTKEVQLIIAKYQNYKTNLTTEYMLFRAKIDKTTLTIYKTNKLLLQGGNSHQVYQDICTTLGKPTSIQQEKQIHDFNFSIIGSDEVGTGDYFGGITVCACYIPKEKILTIRKLGVKDSKKISDSKILALAPKLIKETLHSVILLNNEKYNEITKNNINLNKIKAVLHNKTLIKLLKKNINYDKIIIDGFTTTTKYFHYLQKQPHIIEDVKLEEHAEDKYVAVATASIIARYYFLKHLEDLSQKYNYNLAKGAGKKVDELLTKIITDNNKEILPYIAKLNFNNTKKVKKGT